MAFAWCRGQQKKDPQRFDPEDMLWKQKWVVGRLDEFPHISRKQIADALDDVEQSFAKVDAGKRAALKLRYQMARDMGDTAEAERLWDAWLAAPRDHLTDCRVCELDDELDHHVDRGEWEQALREGAPILEGAVLRGDPAPDAGHAAVPVLQAGAAGGGARLPPARLRDGGEEPRVPGHRGRAPGVPGADGQPVARADAAWRSTWAGRWSTPATGTGSPSTRRRVPPGGIVAQGGRDTVSLRLPKLRLPVYRQREGAYAVKRAARLGGDAGPGDCLAFRHCATARTASRGCWRARGPWTGTRTPSPSTRS